MVGWRQLHPVCENLEDHLGNFCEPGGFSSFYFHGLNHSLSYGLEYSLPLPSRGFPVSLRDVRSERRVVYLPSSYNHAGALRYTTQSTGPWSISRAMESVDERIVLPCVIDADVNFLRINQGLRPSPPSSTKYFRMLPIAPEKSRKSCLRGSDRLNTVCLRRNRYHETRCTPKTQR